MVLPLVHIIFYECFALNIALAFHLWVIWYIASGFLKDCQMMTYGNQHMKYCLHLWYLLGNLSLPLCVCALKCLSSWCIWWFKHTSLDILAFFVGCHIIVSLSLLVSYSLNLAFHVARIELQVAEDRKKEKSAKFLLRSKTKRGKTQTQSACLKKHSELIHIIRVQMQVSYNFFS